MVKRLFAALLLLCVLAGCAGQPAQPGMSGPQIDPAARRTSALTERECPQQDNFGYDEHTRCAWLTVPARHGDPDSAEMKLGVVIFSATGEAPKPDPVVFLWFGPGAELQYAPAFPYFFQRLRAEHDIITLDHRGAGISTPAPDCPELATAYYETLDLDPSGEETLARFADARQACWDRWQDDEVDLDAFTTAEVVEDLEDLRYALKVKQWNVAAVGYGGRAALELVGKYPNTVRALVLDDLGPDQPQSYLGYADRREAMLERFFQLCAEDASCAAAYPTLKERFSSAVEALNASPARLKVQDPNSGARYTVYVDGGRLIDATLTVIQFNFMEFFPELPRMIDQVASDRYDVLTRLYGQILPFFEPATPLFNARYACMEAVPRSARGDLMKLDAAQTPIRTQMRAQLAAHFDACALWEGQPEAPAFQPPGGNLPVLVLHGGFYSSDAAWAEKATANLEQRQTVEIVDGISAGYLGAPGASCAMRLMEDFLIDPEATLDTQCVTEKRKYIWITMQE